MIRIDKIAFEFRMDREAFAYDLYANWDEFCRINFEKVVEEYLTAYDRKKIHLEIDSLELDLGTIPENDFYQLFPIRLHEALQRKLQLSPPNNVQIAASWNARLENFIHYLSEGFCHEEWADADFDVSEELNLLLEHLPHMAHRLMAVCLHQENASERLFKQTDTYTFIQLITQWQADRQTSMDEKAQSLVHLTIKHPSLVAGILAKLEKEKPLFHLVASMLYKGLKQDPTLSSEVQTKSLLQVMKYLPENLRKESLTVWKESMLWLFNPTLTLYEKRRYLGIILDAEPRIPVRFIHETAEEDNLNRMAEILNSVIVRQIIITESENHAEVDVPEYWHYLYDWLIAHYPFNGLATFGNKENFRKHLNRKLLMFIRKRDYGLYLSKAELTQQFLLEVFGSESYVVILNDIYNLQPRNTDGSPVHTGRFDIAFHRILLELSLLKETYTSIKSDKDTEKASELLRRRNEHSSNSYDYQRLTAWIADVRISQDEKRIFLNRMLYGHTEVLKTWIREGAGQQKALLSLLAEQTEKQWVYQLLASISFQMTEVFIQLEHILQSDRRELAWLSGMSSERRSFHVRRSMLEWISTHQDLSLENKEESIHSFFLLLHESVTGKALEPYLATKAAETFNKAMQEQTLDTERTSITQKGFSGSYPDKDWVERTEHEVITSIEKLVQHICLLIADMTISESEKRRLLVRWLDACPYSYGCILLSIEQEGNGVLLIEFVKMLHPLVLERILIGMMGEISDTAWQENLRPVIYWILQHHTSFDNYLVGKKAEFEKKALVLLAEWSTSNILSGKTSEERLRLLIVGLFGEEQVSNVLSQIHQSLMQEPDILKKTIQPWHLTRLLIQCFYQTCTEWNEYTNTVPNISHELENRLISGIGGHTNKEPESMQLDSSRDALDSTQEASTQSPTFTTTELSALLDDSRTLPVWDKKEWTEYLRNERISTSAKGRILHLLIQQQPDLVLNLIRHLFTQNIIPSSQWNEWFNERDYLRLWSEVSIMEVETLQQVIDYLLERQFASTSTIRNGLLIYLTTITPESYYLRNPTEIIRMFIDSWKENLSTDQWMAIENQMHSPENSRERETPIMDEEKSVTSTSSIEDIKDQLIDRMFVDLAVSDSELETMTEDDPKEPSYLIVPNAGLALIAPWFIRLFHILGYLNEKKDGFKNQRARVRAIFLLQYLTFGKEQEYKEAELAFNRILVGYPHSFPLPKYLKLTKEERETAEGMLVGVKANWQKMKNTSVESFRQSFIERSGRLEQRDEKWVLTVDERAYDILLESLPWSYNTIRFPWLKKRINVVWRNKEEVEY